MVADSGYQEIDHVADRAYRIWAADLGGLLSAGARALYDLAGISVGCGTREERGLELEAPDRESLLIAWLNELLLLLEKDRIAFAQFDFADLSDIHVRATGRGKVSSQVPKEIKAATYHRLTIASSSRGLEATVVFDV